MFGLVQIKMPLQTRKPYLKPWLQHTRGSYRERSPQIFSSEKKQSPRHGRKLLWKKTESPLFVDSVFSSSGKKTESTASPPPCQGLCFFFRVEIFGLLSPSLPLVSLSQGFGYGFPACNGIIICTRPNILKTLLRKRAT